MIGDIQRLFQGIKYTKKKQQKTPKTKNQNQNKAKW